MNIIFNSIKIENFLSFENAIIDFRKNGIVVVDGKNECETDHAYSNGSGKSSLFEAILWCLTGETVRGVKDVVCKYGNDGTCVTLSFFIDDNEYNITRTKNHSKYKTNLFIKINGEDKSGKGIRDTEAILKNILPDISASLVGSVIILGQGLPHKFTSNTPSGRKEVLEKLSKSDFMIEDIKQKVEKRKSFLNENKNKLDIENSSINGQLTSLSAILDGLKSTLEKLKLVDIENIQVDIKMISNDIDTLNKSILNKTEELSACRNDITNLLSTKMADINNKYDSLKNDLRDSYTFDAEELNKLYAKKEFLSSEIKRIESIVDICPTCGQKIVGVEKPSTASLSKELREVLDKVRNIENEQLATRLHINDELNKLEQERSEEKSLIQEEVDEKTASATSIENCIIELNRRLSIINKELYEKKSLVDKYESELSSTKSKIEEITSDIDKLNKKLLYNNKELEVLGKRISIIGKIDTLIKRDFRGYLLKSVVSYINDKAKKYSDGILESNLVEFKIDGNNIDILYDKKEYESLSGGERQKVDVVIQFSLRDMLSKYLNFSSNILVLDELTDNIDYLGAEKLFNVITNKLTDVESVYIISHHKDFQIGYDKILTIVKGNDKISRVM